MSVANEILQLAKPMIGMCSLISMMNCSFIMKRKSLACNEKGVVSKPVYIGDAVYTAPKGPNKLLFIAQPQKILHIEASLNKEFADKVEIVRSKPNFLEINSMNCTKGNTLAHMVSELGLKPEQVVAFGNSQNDISMLKYAGTAVAWRMRMIM